jgi:cytoskeletal protein CcmA (bactofilin family)
MSAKSLPGWPLAPVLALLLVSCHGTESGKPQEGTGTVILPATEIHEGWYFAAGQSVIIEGTVNGDVFAAGGSVDISGTVNGDVVVAAGDVTVSGTVSDDIRAAGGTIRIEGKVGKNVTAAGGDLTVGRNAEISGALLALSGQARVSGTVKKDLMFKGGSATVSGTVGGNVNVEGDEFSTLPGAHVAGNVKARVRDESRLKIAEGSVTGKVEFVKATREEAPTILGRSPGAFWFKILWTLWLFLSGLVLFALFRKIFIGYSAALRQRTVPCALWGIAGLVVLPIAMILLAITIVGMPFALLLFDLYFWMAYFSQLSTALLLGDLLFRNRESGGWAPFWAFAVGLLIVQVLTFIPYVTALVVIVGLVLGFGALLLLIGDAWKLRRAPQAA